MQIEIQLQEISCTLYFISVQRSNVAYTYTSGYYAHSAILLVPVILMKMRLDSYIYNMIPAGNFVVGMNQHKIEVLVVDVTMTVDISMHFDPTTDVGVVELKWKV